MQFKFLLYISLAGMAIPVFTQDVNLSDARLLAMSEAGVTSCNSWSGISNPAGLGLYPSFDIVLNCNNLYLLPELSTYSVLSTVPAEFGNINPAFSYFGNSSYNEIHLMMAYGKRLAKWLSLGVNIAYHIQSFEFKKEKYSAITGQLGVLAIPSKGWKIGVNIFNPTSSAYGRYCGEELVSGVQTGVSVSKAKSYYLAMQLNFIEFRVLSYCFGVEFYLDKKFAIRAGLKFPESLSFSFGTGVSFKKYFIDLGFEQHCILGLSSSFTLSYKIK